mmetsp:Transcript_26790/g.77407  ORF Transcript_26790/g.77407 Transcript_26790/m.77407 type:complete len:463 (+) Transcript_26790:52-1440(+)
MSLPTFRPQVAIDGAQMERARSSNSSLVRGVSGRLGTAIACIGVGAIFAVASVSVYVRFLDPVLDTVEMAAADAIGPLSEADDWQPTPSLNTSANHTTSVHGDVAQASENERFQPEATLNKSDASDHAKPDALGVQHVPSAEARGSTAGQSHTETPAPPPPSTTTPTRTTTSTIRASSVGRCTPLTRPRESPAQGSEPQASILTMLRPTPPLGTDWSFMLEDHGRCQLVLLTGVFSTAADTKMSEHFDSFIRSVLRSPSMVKTMVLHDGLPGELVSHYSTADGSVSFVPVGRPDGDSVVDRLHLRGFLEQLDAHPEWETVFISDMSKVALLHNPCMLVGRHTCKLFIASEASSTGAIQELRECFDAMGGKYREWFNAVQPRLKTSVNLSVIGGKRPVVRETIAHLISVLEDPLLPKLEPAAAPLSEMGAINWLIGSKFTAEDVVTGTPLLGGQRKDVYFRYQ